MESLSSNPMRLEAWLETLTVREHAIFDKGFATALEAVLEDFTDARIKLFSKLQEIQDDDGDCDDPDYRKQLLARVSVLDIYEKHYKKRIGLIKPAVAALETETLEY